MSNERPITVRSNLPPVPVYVGLTLVFAIAAGTAWLISASDWVKGMIATPGVLALFGVLIQIARDAAQFEKQKYLQSDQQIFSLGANSHMSNAAFDKHVEFCEAYMSEVHQTVSILFQKGPTKEAIECAQRLFELKRKYAAWMPKAVALKLEPFENALHKIGTEKARIAELGADLQNERARAIERLYALFMNLMNLEAIASGPDHKEELAIENVKEKVRAILGINELTEIRDFIISRSAAYARKHSP